MAEYASNCPISRPIDTGYKADKNLGGFSWSYEWGMFFSEPVPEMLPIRAPAPRFRRWH